MKVKDAYYKLLNDNKKSLIFIKSGMFYVIYDAGAYITNIIFGYQIKNNRVGFPLKSISKIIEQLDKIKVNYIVYNSDEEYNFRNFDNNNYDYYYNLYKKKEYEERCKKVLIERILYLIDLNKDNYNKIKEYIDEFKI